ncbi:MAG: hypothetical protein JEZ03_15190 [Bacteroidales bacterium]|nr:hypothetical protein [Bacteroidales bacterium]
MKNHHKILTFIFILFFGQLFSQSNTNIVIGEKHTIHSDVLDQDREIFIHLPDGYDNCVSDYPVIYVLDGENTFNTISGLTDLNAWLNIMPKMIVVGIPNIDRQHDFMPINDTIPTSGNADKFVSFFNQELFPYIKENYRIASFKMIFGFSYTGMFTLHCFKNYPETFNAYIAGSPSLYHNIDKLCENEISIKSDTDKRFLHISIGELESQEYIDNINRFTSYLDKQSHSKILWESITVDAATHETNLPFSISYGLNYIFSDWVKIKQVIYQGIDSVESHFEVLSNQYGYTVKTPEKIYQLLGVYYLENNIVDKSIEIFEKYTQTYESSWTAFDYLGQAFVAKNDIKKAEVSFLKSLELKPDYKIAKDNLEKIKDELDKTN